MLHTSERGTRYALAPVAVPLGGCPRAPVQCPRIVLDHSLGASVALGHPAPTGPATRCASARWAVQDRALVQWEPIVRAVSVTAIAALGLRPMKQLWSPLRN